MRSIHTDEAPKVVGPYSQAIEHNDLIFLSGQIGIDPTTATLTEGITAQTRQIFANLRAVLLAAGKSLDNVLKVTVYLTDINDYATVNKIYEEEFGDHKPARAAVQVAKLPAGALIEIELIASRS